MRITRVVLAAALLALPYPAASQAPGSGAAPAGSGQKPAEQPAKPAAAPQEPAAEGAATGFFDFGVRFSDIQDDDARYERYRDLGDGLFVETVRYNRGIGGRLFAFNADHVGRRDQRLFTEVMTPGKYKASFLWDQIPMLLSRTTRTLHSGIGSGELTIDDALQGQVQATPSAIASVFQQSARTFETKTRRHIAEGRFAYAPTESLTVTTNFRRTDREGTIPFGGSFGHSSLVEIPAPTQHNLSDFDASAEYVRNPLLLRAGYTGSWFSNDVTSVIFDNPFRRDDLAATSSRGRLTLAPSNSFVGVNGLASVRLPHRSRATAYVSVGVLKDSDDPLVPQTINSAITAAPVERSTVEGEAGTHSINLSFVSRPRRYADISVRFRTYEYDNRTPEMALTQRVSYDNTPSPISPAIHTEPYSVSRGTFDADFRWLASGRTSAGVGYSRLGEERTHRIYESTTDNVVRLTFDTIGRQWFTLRSKYEHAQKRGEGLDEDLLASIGEQPALRQFDVASRDRDRITIIGAITPSQFVTTSLTFAAGKDDYLESLFGLRDNTHRIVGAGADYAPNDRVSVGLSYSYERYNALQRSRQANPGVQFTDPSRNWAADSTDRTHSLFLNGDVADIGGKLDLRVSYDFSRARARYNYITGAVPDRTLPEEVPVPTTLPTPTELPPTLSEFHRGTFDAAYPLTGRVSIGFSYWYDRYRVADFTLDVDANPELARGQALLMGYLYRPYTANTGWVRLLYRF